jgi:serine/threonine protein kinase
MSEPHVLGEGTYGCVHAPPMKCKDQDKLVNTDIASKIMTTKEAKKELGEYVLIGNADKKEEYYLGKPKHCIADWTESNVHALRKCHGKWIKLFKMREQEYSLLLMKNGGVNIIDFADKMGRLRKTPENTRIMELFWIEAQRIFRGLTVLLDKGILHFDLKGENIVYDEKKNRINFIDFGLMEKKNDIINKTKQSKYDYANIHWSYPLEIKFYNHDKFKSFVDISDKKNYVSRILTRNHDNLAFLFNYTMDNDKQFHSYIPSIFRKKPSMLILKKMDYINTYLDYLVSLKLSDYDNFIRKSINTFDSYGTSIGLLYLLLKTSHLIEPTLYNELKIIFENMVSPDLNVRLLPLQNMILYERALEKSGVLMKYHKKIKNHYLTDIDASDHELFRSISNFKSVKRKISRKEFEKMKTSLKSRIHVTRKNNRARSFSPRIKTRTPSFMKSVKSRSRSKTPSFMRSVKSRSRSNSRSRSKSRSSSHK